MSELELKNLVKIYPFTEVTGVFGRKKAAEALEREKQMPYTTNEGVIAVQKFSLSIEKGEFIVLLGPSGCGKTSILRMIAGLEDVSSGDILLDGESMLPLRPEERDVAMIFQNYSLYPNYTVYDNLAFPLRNLHMPRRQLDEAVRETAELLELEELLDRRPAELSGGQRQRTAIGRALVRKPRLFLMDEPFSNLDAALRLKLRGELKRIHQKLGVTFIYVTHEQSEAFALGERIVVMRDGMMVETGTPQELYNRPRKLYTAAFVGNPPMNRLGKAKLVRGGGGWLAEVLGERFPIPDKRAGVLTDADDGREALALVRPVHTLIGESGIRATVSYVETVGAELHIHLKTSGAELISIVPADSGASFLRGDEVKIDIPPSRLHLFDEATEERII